MTLKLPSNMAWIGKVFEDGMMAWMSCLVPVIGEG